MLLKGRLKNKVKGQDFPSVPQTEQVFDLPKIDFQSHQWIQRGYFIYDSCPTCLNQAIPLPLNKMLIKQKGEYRLVDENSDRRSTK